MLKRGHSITFICDTNYSGAIQGVNVILTSKSSSTDSRNHFELPDRFKFIFHQLSSSGYQPDIAFSHSGWGCGFFLRQYFPSALSITYAEWWHSKTLQDSNLPKLTYCLSRDQYDSNICRNSLQAYELLNADHIITPTHWQKSQFPALFSEKMHVAHEGIDPGVFRLGSQALLQPEKPLSQKRLLRITYVSRGLESIRCFPEFINFAILLSNNYPNIQFDIIGEDRICYGGKPPRGFKSYQSWACHAISKYSSRPDTFIFHGRLPFSKYFKLLSKSDIHIYFTRPFVVSWSLIEAMAFAKPIIYSSTQNVLEIVNDDRFSCNPQDLNECFNTFASLLSLEASSLRSYKTDLFSRARMFTPNQFNTLVDAIIDTYPLTLKHHKF